MVSASKDIMKIVGNGTNKFVQSYNQYDSKKSGGVTICNLRMSDKQINAPFYVTTPDIVVVTKEEYLFKFDMIDDLKENGIFIINTTKSKEEMNGYLPNHVKNVINDKNIKLYIIDADAIAVASGIKGKISKIMEMIILSLLEYPNAKEEIEKSIEKQFATKGNDIINANINAIKSALDNLVLVGQTATKISEAVKEEAEKQGKDIKIYDYVEVNISCYCGLMRCGYGTVELQNVKAHESFMREPSIRSLDVDRITDCNHSYEVKEYEFFDWLKLR